MPRFYVGRHVGRGWVGTSFGGYRHRRPVVVRHKVVVRRQPSPAFWPVVFGLMVVAVLLYYWYVSLPVAVISVALWRLAYRRTPLPASPTAPSPPPPAPPPLPPLPHPPPPPLPQA